MFDCHVHTDHSHDGKATAQEQCIRAMELGLSGIALTDHFDIYKQTDSAHIRASVAQAKELDRRFAGRLRVLSGVEIGDGMTVPPRQWEEFVGSLPFDVVLGSVHNELSARAVRDDVRSGKMFDRFSEEEIPLFLEQYYRNTLRLVREYDFDVLTHLTFPLRYLNGMFHRGVTIGSCDGLIGSVLREVIARGLALEINTSAIGTDWSCLIPDEPILRRYYEMGGRKITLGSDAHTTARMGVGLREAIETAKRVGFSEYCYFSERKEVRVTLD